LVAGIAVAVLLNRLFHVELSHPLLRGFLSMNPLTACCFITLSISLALLRPSNAGGLRKRLGEVAALLVLTIGAIKLLSVALGWDLAFDQWLFAEQFDNGANAPPRIAVRAALGLVLASAALLCLEVQTRRGRRPTEVLCAVYSTLALLALMGYSYGLIVYYNGPGFLPMSLPAAIAFLLLAAGTLLARPNGGAMAIIMSDTAGGLLARLLIPLGIVLPLLLGTLRLGGEEAGWYSTRLGVALFATVFLAVFLAAVWWSTRLLFRAETKRQQAEERAKRLNAELEERVADRTAALHALNEELQEASKAKDQFLAALSHELRTPLTPVLMCAAALEQDNAMLPEFREQLGMVRRNVELEARLIDDLLDLTRVAHGKLELHRAVADIHSLLTHTEQIVRSTALSKSVNLRLTLDATSHHVMGDAARLHQVFWNVLKNAIKFTPAGGQIIARTTNPGPGRICFEVRDTGIGIDPKVLPSIFSAFVQGDRSSVQASSGLGLGMSIAKSIIELHGGNIRAHSAGPGTGATFTIELDTTTADTENAWTPVTASSAGRVYRLLVVEDHPPTLEVLARLLRKQGHEVSTAATVEAALALASQHAFDLVISDIGLPDGNGVDLMIQLTRDYGLRGIALSGYGMEEDLERTKRAGFIAHLVKPIDFERLNHVLEQVARAA